MIDILLAACALFLTFPSLVVIAILIKLGSHGPIFLRQKKVGDNGKEFTLYIFRTVVREKAPCGLTYSRINKMGRILRRNALDLVPILFNVLKGDVSFLEGV